VTHVPSFAESSSAGDGENDWLQQMQTRIHQLEQDMRVRHGMATIIKRKSELAIEAERYAMTELHKATESLNGEFLQFPPSLSFLVSLMLSTKSSDDVSTISLDNHSSEFI
jgi:hypothetical protein